jgi:hypothetical protein
MLRVGLEPMTSVFQPAKTVHALDRAATVIGIRSFIHSSIHSSMALQPFVGPWPLLQFRNLFFYTGGRTPGTGISPLQGRYLHTGRQNKRTHRHPYLEWDSKP